MKFNKSLDWLKESDEDDNLLEDDELDVVDEELNEGLYVDPANYDKHSDLVDVVDKAGNSQKMTQATYDKNKGSGEFKDAEPKEKEQDKEVDKEQEPDKEQTKTVGTKRPEKFDRETAIDYINKITNVYEPGSITTVRKDYYNDILEYDGELRNPDNWPTNVKDIFDHQYKIRHKLYDQFKDYALTDEQRQQDERHKQQYREVYDDATKALKNVDAKERFDIIDDYYANGKFRDDDEYGSKSEPIKHLLRSFDYDIKNKNDMKRAYKDLKQKIS